MACNLAGNGMFHQPLKIGATPYGQAICDRFMGKLLAALLVVFG
jgi:hypothetical protein